MKKGKKTKERHKKRRACGTRDKESLYATFPSSALGYPLEYFYIDPVSPHTGKQLRAPKPITVETTNEKGETIEVTHLLLGVGKTYYPSPVDFIEEVKQHGISKKIPIVSIPWEQLDPGRSNFYLIHPRAIPAFPYEAEYDCPYEILERKKKHIRKRVKRLLRTEDKVVVAEKAKAILQAINQKLEQAPEKHECIGALWPLATLLNNRKHQLYKKPEHIPELVQLHLGVLPDSIEGEQSMVVVWDDGIPLFKYKVQPPQQYRKPIKWKPGMFLRFPVGFFDYVSDYDTVPKDIREQMHADKKEWKIRVTDT